MSTAERQHPRFAAEVSVKFYLDTQVAEGRTRNLSRGGLCADLPVALPVGSDVDIDATLLFDDDTESEALRLPARVVWCTAFETGFQIGVAFRPLDKERAQYLSTFLAYLGDEKAPRQPKAVSVDDRFR